MFAVLLTTVILSISVSILTIARKEVILSSSAKESFSAVYIADGALDCAILNDRTGAFTSNGNESINCGYSYDYVPVTHTTFGGTGSDHRYTFYIKSFDAVTFSPCAKVTVDRYASPARTVIEARGYNMGYDPTAGTCGASHPKKVERAFRYSYTN